MIQASPIAQQEQRLKLKIKALLESVGYRDGISGLSWGFSSATVSGRFADRDGSKIFEFEVDENGVSYRPIDRLSYGYRSAAALTSKKGIRSDSRKRQCSSPTSYPCGNSCISNQKRCRIRDPRTKQMSSAIVREARSIKLAQGSVKPSSANVERVLKQEEDRIRNQPIENMAIVDPVSGSVILRKRGQKTSIDVTVDELAKSRGAIVTHNHPNVNNLPKSDPRSAGPSFSDSDIQIACIGQVAEVRAVSAGYNHSMKPPPGGWNFTTWNRKIQPAYRRNFQAVYRESVNDIWYGRISAEQADAEFYHKVWERTAKDTGMEYRRWSVKR